MFSVFVTEWALIFAMFHNFCLGIVRGRWRWTSGLVLATLFMRPPIASQPSSLRLHDESFRCRQTSLSKPPRTPSNPCLRSSQPITGSGSRSVLPPSRCSCISLSLHVCSTPVYSLLIRLHSLSFLSQGLRTTKHLVAGMCAELSKFAKWSVARALLSSTFDQLPWIGNRVVR